MKHVRYLQTKKTVGRRGQLTQSSTRSWTTDKVQSIGLHDVIHYMIYTVSFILWLYRFWVLLRQRIHRYVRDIEMWWSVVPIWTEFAAEISWKSEGEVEAENAFKIQCFWADPYAANDEFVDDQCGLAKDTKKWRRSHWRSAEFVFVPSYFDLYRGAKQI